MDNVIRQILLRSLTKLEGTLVSYFCWRSHRAGDGAIKGGGTRCAVFIILGKSSLSYT